MPTAVVVMIALSGLVAVPCGVSMWRRGGSVVGRVAWSLVLLFPVLGPIAFGALYRRPPRRVHSAGDGFDATGGEGATGGGDVGGDAGDCGGDADGGGDGGGD